MLKNQLDFIKVILLGLWLLLLAVGCQSATSEDNKIVVVTQVTSSEPTTALPTATTITLHSLVPPSNTPTRTYAPSPAHSPTPALTLTPFPTETTAPTPWPTLPPDEAANRVLTLLAENQNPNCLLPCWWGATPGQTHWQDIEPFLNSLAIAIYYSASDISFGAEVILPLPESVSVINSSDYHGFYGWSESGIIHGIQVAPMNISGYDAKTMITLYGVPDEVWLTTIDEPREGVLPFQLIIVYQQQGISFRYYVDATRIGDTVTACFEPGIELERPDLFPASPRIYLWEPGQTKTIQEISPIPLERYFRLEAKTDLTPETLYEKFTNPDDLPCIDTPAALWRN